MYLFDFSLLPESAETVLEFVNLVIALVAVAFSFKIAALMQGGKMESVWNLLAAAVGFFALLEIYEALKLLNVLHVAGLGDILEFGMVVFLVWAFSKARGILFKDVMNK